MRFNANGPVPGSNHNHATPQSLLSPARGIGLGLGGGLVDNEAINEVIFGSDDELDAHELQEVDLDDEVRAFQARQRAQAHATKPIATSATANTSTLDPVPAAVAPPPALVASPSRPRRTIHELSTQQSPGRRHHVQLSEPQNAPYSPSRSNPGESTTQQLEQKEAINMLQHTVSSWRNKLGRLLQLGAVQEQQLFGSMVSTSAPNQASVLGAAADLINQLAVKLQQEEEFRLSAVDSLKQCASQMASMSDEISALEQHNARLAAQLQLQSTPNPNPSAAQPVPSPNPLSRQMPGAAPTATPAFDKLRDLYQSNETSGPVHTQRVEDLNTSFTSQGPQAHVQVVRTHSPRSQAAASQSHGRSFVNSTSQSRFEPERYGAVPQDLPTEVLLPSARSAQHPSSRAAVAWGAASNTSVAWEKSQGAGQGADDDAEFDLGDENEAAPNLTVYQQQAYPPHAQTLAPMPSAPPGPPSATLASGAPVLPANLTQGGGPDPAVNDCPVPRVLMPTAAYQPQQLRRPVQPPQPQQGPFGRQPVTVSGRGIHNTGGSSSGVVVTQGISGLNMAGFPIPQSYPRRS